MHTGGSIIEHFSHITDPQVDRNKEHPLLSVITIAICGVICGADSWTDIEQFGNEKREWLETFLDLPNGIPSHDTFGRVFAMIDSEEFERSFISWVRTIAQLTTGDIVAIDGKTNRRSPDRNIGKDAIHLVSAFATRNGVTLGRRAIGTKSNEMKAIPKLLEILNISGCIVTIDAAGCYSDVVDMIVKRQAEYVIAVKQNQPTLHSDIEQLFSEHQEGDLLYAHTRERNHGRSETRECWVINTHKELQSIRNKKKWKHLNSVTKIANTRTVDGKTTTEHRYYISSLSSGNADQMLSAIRQHWGIENSLHWILDVQFREDDSRIRQGNAQQNFSLLRKITLNLLKQDRSVKVGIAAKRKKAGWSETYLLKILNI